MSTSVATPRLQTIPRLQPAKAYPAPQSEAIESQLSLKRGLREGNHGCGFGNGTGILPSDTGVLLPLCSLVTRIPKIDQALPEKIT
jgi:hypothetical protein